MTYRHYQQQDMGQNRKIHFVRDSGQGEGGQIRVRPGMRGDLDRCDRRSGEWVFIAHLVSLGVCPLDVGDVLRRIDASPCQGA